MIADERTFLQRARRLDADTWSEFYDQFYPRIYAFLLTRVRDGMLAEDLAADVFVNALRAIASYEERGFGVATWLFRIAQNRLIDHFRRSSTHSSDSLDELDQDEALAGGHNPILDPTHSERLDLNNALEQLGPQQRQVVHLRFIEELTSAQVANVMGKSEAAVKIMQHRALKTLQQLMHQKSNTP